MKTFWNPFKNILKSFLNILKSFWWQDDRMTGWQDGRMTKWQDYRIAGLQDHRIVFKTYLFQTINWLTFLQVTNQSICDMHNSTYAIASIYQNILHAECSSGHSQVTNQELMNILYAECSSDAYKTDEHSIWRLFVRRRHVQFYRCYRI